MTARVRRLLLDAALFLLLLALMAYRFTRSAIHEWLSLVLVLAVVLHLCLNSRWLASLFSGRYLPLRAARLVLNLLLAAALGGALVTGAYLSRHLLPFFHLRDLLGLKGSLAMRGWHNFFAHWFFTLAAIHCGLYWRRIFTAQGESPFFRRRLFFAGALCVFFGVAVFIQREMIFPLTLQSPFMLHRARESLITFLMDYCAVFAGLAWCAALAEKGLARLRPGPGKNAPRAQHGEDQP